MLYVTILIMSMIVSPVVASQPFVEKENPVLLSQYQATIDTLVESLLTERQELIRELTALRKQLEPAIKADEIVIIIGKRSAELPPEGIRAVIKQLKQIGQAIKDGNAALFQKLFEALAKFLNLGKQALATIKQAINDFSKYMANKQVSSKRIEMTEFERRSIEPEYANESEDERAIEQVQEQRKREMEEKTNAEALRQKMFKNKPEQVLKQSSEKFGLEGF